MITYRDIVKFNHIKLYMCHFSPGQTSFTCCFVIFLSSCQMEILTCVFPPPQQCSSLSLPQQLIPSIYLSSFSIPHPLMSLFQFYPPALLLVYIYLHQRCTYINSEGLRGREIAHRSLLLSPCLLSRGKTQSGCDYYNHVLFSPGNLIQLCLTSLTLSLSQ